MIDTKIRTWKYTVDELCVSKIEDGKIEGQMILVRHVSDGFWLRFYAY